MRYFLNRRSKLVFGACLLLFVTLSLYTSLTDENSIQRFDSQFITDYLSNYRFQPAADKSEGSLEDATNIDEKSDKSDERSDERSDNKSDENPGDQNPEDAEDNMNLVQFSNVQSDSELDRENEVDTTAEDTTPTSSPSISVENPVPTELIIDQKLIDKIPPMKYLNGNTIFQSFFSRYFELIGRNRLSYPLKRRTRMKEGKVIIDHILFHNDENEILSETDCRAFFHFPKRFVEDLKKKHKIITDNLPDVVPNFYKGDGYVIVGGGKYSWFSILVIETLRKLGSILPVEVILPTEEEYELEFCETILPKLNARCIQLSKVFGDTINKYNLSGYQYKAFALLASSFENAFLVDADTYPVTNPDLLFKSDVYNKFNMITWPDYWRRTTSPLFYDIRGTPLGEQIRHLNDDFTNVNYFKDQYGENLQNDVPMHDRKGSLPDWTTESGEMLINKKIHFKTLLLALYYNFDGPSGYYPLLSQGGAGEGDKETFVAAANYFDLPFYQVYKMPDRAYGYYMYGAVRDTSIVQYNPIKDYQNLQIVKDTILKDIREKEDDFVYSYPKYFTDFFQIGNAEPMFYHVHETKMEPYDLVERKLTIDPETGVKNRNLGCDFPRADFDLEQFLWETIDQYICQNNIKFDYFKKKNRDSICKEFIHEELAFLKLSHDKAVKEFKSDPGDPLANLERIN